MPLFTVFTPTYNRSHTISRVYKSLQSQSTRDFEWLIIDDGSTDNTRELIDQWKKESDFSIRYVWQENGHKKSAFNHGVNIAKGELFLTADSDDEFTSNALERFAFHWRQIPDELRKSFIGVCGLCKDQDNAVVGDCFPCQSIFDSNAIEIRYKYKVSGEKWGFSRTDILKEYPFPDNISGFVPEGVVWSKTALKYQTRFINEALRIYFFDSGNQISNRIDPRKDAAGLMYWSKNVILNEINWFFYNPFRFIYEASRWNRLFLHLGWRKSVNNNLIPMSIFSFPLLFISFFPGLLWWLSDIWKSQD